MARDIRAGGAFVEMSLKDDALRKGLRRASRNLDNFAASVGRVGAGFTAASAAIAAPLTLASRRFLQVGDNLDKLSQRTGIAVEQLSRLEFAAKRSGATLGDVGNAVQRANRRIGRITAGEGTATQVEALEALGLSARRLEQLDPRGRLLAIADAFEEFDDKAEAAGLSQRAFGTEVDKLIPLLLRGSAGINALGDQAEDLGIVLGEDISSSAAELADALGTVSGQARAVAIEVGAALAPALQDVAKSLQQIVPDVRDFVRQNRELVVTAAQTAAGLAAIGGALLSVAAAAKAASIAFALFSANPIVFTATIASLAALSIGFRGAEIAGRRLDETLARLVLRVNPAVDASFRFRDALEAERAAAERVTAALQDLEGARTDQERRDALRRAVAAQRERIEQRDEADRGTPLSAQQQQAVGRLESVQRELDNARAELARRQQIAAQDDDIVFSEDTQQQFRDVIADLAQARQEAIAAVQRLNGSEIDRRLQQQLEDLELQLEQVGKVNPFEVINSGLADIPTLLEDAASAGRKFLDTLKEINQPLLDRIEDLQIAGIEDDLERTIARINAKSDRERRRLAEEGGSPALVERARELEIEQARAEFREREQRQRERAEKRLQEELARERISQIEDEEERRRRTIELERRLRIEAAREAGRSEAFIEQIRELFDLRLQGVGDDLASEQRLRGQAVSFFDARSASLQNATTNPEEQTAKNTRDSAKLLGEMLRELRDKGGLVFVPN